MNKIFLSMLFFFLFLIPLNVYAQTQKYFVTQHGSGSQNGLSLSNAWSISIFNNSSNWSQVEDSNKVDPGDIVYFSGTFTSSVRPAGSGSSGKYITLDGYSGGECDPLRSECTSSALLTDYEALFIDDGYDYIKIHDFRMTGRLRVDNYKGTDHSNYIEIKRNYVHDTPNSMIILTAFGGYHNEYITIENNKFTNFGKSQDATQGMNLRVKNAIIRNNIIGHSGASYCTSAEGIELHESQYVLIEGNDIYGAPQQRGIAIKEFGNQDIVIRFNKIHNNPDGSILIGWPTTERIYIYGNAFFDNQGGGSGRGWGIDIGDAAHHIYIWSNLFYDNAGRGIVTWWSPNRGYDQSLRTHDVYIINNVFARNGSTSDPSWTAIALGERSTNTVVKNNIFYNNRPVYPYNQIYISSEAASTSKTFEGNQYYQDGQTPTIYWAGKFHNLTKFKSLGYENSSTIDNITKKPNFTDPNSNDFSLTDDVTNPGVVISEKLPTLVINNQVIPLSFDFVIDPNKTIWESIPPRVVTMTKTTNNKSIKGAYEINSSIDGIALNPPENVRVFVD